jgi:hypothetical protein
MLQFVIRNSIYPPVTHIAGDFYFDIFGSIRRTFRWITALSAVNNKKKLLVRAQIRRKNEKLTRTKFRISMPRSAYVSQI